MTTTNEPEVIAELRGWHREGCESLFTIGEVLAVDIADILAAYDAIVAERDAAVRETQQERERGDHWRDAYDEAKARVIACERDLNYIRRVTVGAVESDKLAATCKTIGEYRYVLLKAMHAYGIAAVAAETQATPHAGGTDA